MKLKILSGSDVRRVITIRQSIAAVKEAYIQISTGKAEIPLRTSVPVQHREGMTLFMPAYLANIDALGAKIVSIFPKNMKRNLPTIHSVVFIVDAVTGQPVAMQDIAVAELIRTGPKSLAWG